MQLKTSEIFSLFQKIRIRKSDTLEIHTGNPEA